MPAFPPEPSPWDDAFPPHSQALSPNTDPKTQGNKSSTARDSRAFVTAPDELKSSRNCCPALGHCVSGVSKLLPDTLPDLSRLAFCRKNGRSFGRVWDNSCLKSWGCRGEIPDAQKAALRCLFRQ